jgi:hypothetical protein
MFDVRQAAVVRGQVGAFPLPDCPLLLLQLLCLAGAELAVAAIPGDLPLPMIHAIPHLAPAQRPNFLGRYWMRVGRNTTVTCRYGVLLPLLLSANAETNN